MTKQAASEAKSIIPDIRCGIPWCAGSCPSLLWSYGAVPGAFCSVDGHKWPSVCRVTLRGWLKAREDLFEMRKELTRIRKRIMAGPPLVLWTVDKQTMLAEPCNEAGDPIAQLFAEVVDDGRIRGTLRTMPAGELVADITIDQTSGTVFDPRHGFDSDARNVLCDLFWSWWRREALSPESGPLDAPPKQKIREPKQSICYYCGGVGTEHVEDYDCNGEPYPCSHCGGKGFEPAKEQGANE